MELFRDHRVATGLAVLAGGLSLAGCTHTHESNGTTHLPYFNRGELVVHEPGSSSNIDIYCQGPNLIYDSGEKDIWLNNPACTTGTLSLSDIK